MPKKTNPDRSVDTGVVAASIPEIQTFPIVGIGASAGGLEAFEQFLRLVPIDSGAAFVLIPHLDPDHESMLADILGRVTKMPVIEAEDQMLIQPDHVYIIPPNRMMTIHHAMIHLSMPDTVQGQRMKIDLFFRSLAEELGDKAIGIVLSGTGTDGTLGLRAIQGGGGLTFVQDPNEARYNGMPSSAIDSGYATYILPVARMPAQLISGILNLFGAIPASHPAIDEATESNNKGAISRILRIIRTRTGHDFSQYKKSTITRRIARRISVLAIEDILGYARYVEEHPDEVKILFREILINVTSFFRDPEAFEFLKTKVLPDLIRNKNEYESLRVWVPGCATGEEAYSLAIIIREVLEDLEKDCKVQIYSTDIAEDVIAVARKGFYPPNITADISPERLKKYFIRQETGFQVNKEIREMVIYATQDLIKDPPFTKLDLLSCRNLLIYLESELQSRLIPAFHYALKPGGILFLSSSESIGGFPDLFKQINRKWRIYEASGIKNAGQILMETPFASRDEHPPIPHYEIHSGRPDASMIEQTKRELLLAYAPPSVVTDDIGTILYVHGDTGKFLRPAQGQATLSVIEMAREGLQLDLRTAIFTAKAQQTIVTYKNLQVRTNDGYEAVNLEVRPITRSGALHGNLIISFHLAEVSQEDLIQKQKSDANQINPERVTELEQELLYTKENLQATIEEMQAANEELKSTNEELQSTNEELQSTNEELETSKEEIQSVNEEIMSVNAELQEKIIQLDGIQSDMKNLLSSTGIGTIFLDVNLAIRWFTPETAILYRLVSSDVGRPLSDIKSLILNDNLLEEAAVVLDSLVPKEKEIQTTDNRWFLVRILPYRTLKNVIDGVVLSFIDINNRKRAEEEAVRSREYAENIIDTIREPLLVLDNDLTVISVSQSYYQMFLTSPVETEGKNLIEIGNSQWSIPHLIALLHTIVPEKTSFEDVTVNVNIPGIGEKTLILNARCIWNKKGGQNLILLAMEDVSELKRTKEAFHEANNKLKLLSSLTRHDIINQISVILSTFDLIDAESIPESFKKWVQISIDACQKMEASIGFTKEYESFGTISSGWQSVSPLIDSAVSEINPEGVSIENQIPKNIEIYAEPILRKVFSTLMENAVRHGKNLTRIQFSAMEQEGRYLIICEDDGGGIPEDQKAFIFNHGYGTHTGIGLFLGREILSITGLSITECGVQGTGARFEITIPSGKFRNHET
ncbi:chemotaxis protein CheB [Methanospirillum lacunae]|uniref:protein-glutamate O-methyltransferase n=1 Tax=Methanospirillum lacunae TaxID=668570 RepID=A0A2V2NDN5_9EURY|nr:chemotaxis protein CheB [Methanospirillum lacunae]PWR73711.1 SAM-dependent methyltransferase [Methanospirillum lacunae]